MKKIFCLMIVACMALALGLSVPALGDDDVVVIDIPVDATYVKSNSTTWTGTMVVSEDVTITSRITVGDNVHLILNEGKTLNAPKGIFVGNGRKLTISGSGTLNAGTSVPQDHSRFCAGIGGGWVQYSDIGTVDRVIYPDCGTIIINGGTINAWGSRLFQNVGSTAHTGGFAAGIGGGAAFHDGIVVGGDGGTIIINGGTVNAWGDNGGAGIGGAGGNAGRNSGSGGSITVTGGTVNAHAESSISQSGAGIGSGKFGTEYSITIMGDAIVTATSNNYGTGIGGGDMSAGGSIVIKGNSHVTAKSKLAGAGIGSGYKSDSGSIVIGGNAHVTAECEVDGAGIGGGSWSNGGSIEIGGNAVVEAKSYCGAGIGGGVNANSGTILIKENADITVPADDERYGGGAGIGGGNCMNNEGHSGGKITIEGGTINVIGSEYGPGIGNGVAAGPVSIIIKGGTVRAEGGNGAAGIGAGQLSRGDNTIIIEGGQVTALSGNHGAGIGGGWGCNGGNITIRNGTVNATARANDASGQQGAGIGAGAGYDRGTNIIMHSDNSVSVVGGSGTYTGGNGGTITIEGGNITANGAVSAAGIGGAYMGSGGTITIKGGDITANGGDYGAGIGGGYKGNSGTIKISGGTIRGNGGEKGAGIGSGFQADGGTISISGGNVICTGGKFAADIGGGYRSNGGVIEISGGNADAMSYSSRHSNSSAGIGGGQNGNAATIRISGGTVNAYAFDKDFWAKGITGNVELSYTDSSLSNMSVYSNAYTGTVKIATGQNFVDAVNVYNGTLTATQKSNIENQTLLPWNGKTVNIADGQQSRLSVDQHFAAMGRTIHVTVWQDDGWTLEKLYYIPEGEDAIEIPTNNGTGNFVMPDRDVTVMAVGDKYFNIALRKDDVEVTGNETKPPVVSWSTIVNPSCSMTMTGMKLRATIDDNSRQYLTMNGGNGLTISYHNERGLELENHTIAWDNLTDHTSTSWSYSLGQSSVTKPKEVFTFQTSVNVQQVILAEKPPLVGINLEVLDGNNNVRATLHLSCKLKNAGNVFYLDENGNEQICEQYTYTSVTDKNGIIWNSGWYVVNDDVDFNDKNIQISGDVHLILCNNREMVHRSCIIVPEGSSLTIYAQSTESNKMGRMTGGGIGTGTWDSMRCGNITINGGRITEKATRGAGIGSGPSNSNITSDGRIVINNGIVSANGSDNGAGIGCGRRNSIREILITGGTVTAYSESGCAAIGGGENSDGVRICITGGTVNASVYSYFDGAGIGGGHSSGACDITITGGTVTASGSYGAGIGGAHNSSGGEITITGGSLTATSNNGGAGIGSGSLGRGGTIRISGGKVTAVGNGGATGIGKGLSASGDLAIILNYNNESRADMCITTNGFKGDIAFEKNFNYISDNSEILFTPFDSIVSGTLGGGTMQPANVYTVSCETTENGTIAVSPLIAEAGDTITVTATPDIENNYHIAGVYYSDGNDLQLITRDADGNLTFIMPARDVDVTAEFRQQWTVSFSCGDGSGEKLPEILFSGEEYTLPFSAVFIAPTGQRFKEWSVKSGNDDPVVKAPGDTITIVANTTVKAIYEPVSFRIYTSAENGSLMADKQEAFYGDPVTLTLTPDEGFGLAFLNVKSMEEDVAVQKIDDNTYTFVMPAGDVTAEAEFAQYCLVRFVDWNGESLQMFDMLAGATPEYTGETLMQISNAQYIFTFAGWEPEITAVPDDATSVTYTATYTAELQRYEVVFANYDGEALQTTIELYGNTPVYSGQTPTRAADEHRIYTFSGWTPEIQPVTGETVYTATYDATPVLTIGENTVNLKQYETLRCLFTPEENGYYRFRSADSPANPFIRIYDGENLVGRDVYWSGGNYTFDCTAELTGGKTYTVEILSFGADAEVTVNVTTAAMYDITLDQNIEHGSVELAGEETSLTVCEGKRVYIIALPDPDEHYWPEDIIVTDANKNAVDTDGISFLMPASDVTVSARFTEQHLITSTADEQIYWRMMNRDGLTMDGDDAWAAPGAMVEIMIFGCEEGWGVDSFTVTGADGRNIQCAKWDEGGGMPAYGFIMPDEAVTVRIKAIDLTFGDPDFLLPSALTDIKKEAFEGIPARVVSIPESCEYIGPYAFRNCVNLTQIRIPEGCQISQSAFTGCRKVYIYGTPGSPAEEYCQEHENCEFVEE